MACGHVEFDFAVRENVLPKQGRQPAPVLGSEELGPLAIKIAICVSTVLGMARPTRVGASCLAMSNINAAAAIEKAASANAPEDALVGLL